MLIRKLILVLLMAIGLAACALGAPINEITETPTATVTPFVTATQAMTATVATATSTPTVRPTNTRFVTATAVGCQYDLTYIADMSIPDGTVVVAGSTVSKTWRVRNDSTCNLGSGFTFRQVGGDAMTAPAISSPIVGVGQIFDLSVTLTIGTDVANYDDLERANFRMFTATGVPFGDTLFVEIDIVQADDSTDCTPSVSVISSPASGTISQGETNNVSWTLQNTGNCAWEGFTIERLGSGSPLIATNLPLDVPTIAAGANYTFTANIELADSFNGFGLFTIALIMLDDSNNGVGTTLVYQAEGDTTSGSCEWDSDFVDDLTIPDGTVVNVGEIITKTWRLENSGTCPWNEFTFQMIEDEANAFLWADNTPYVGVPFTAPGETVAISVRLIVSDAIDDGEVVRARFQIMGVANNFFGTMPYIEVEVDNP